MTLDVPIHLQDDWNDCGRACAQMVTRAVKGPGHLYEQSTFNSNAGPVGIWATSPDQLEDYLNDKLGPGDPAYSLLITGTRTTAMSRLLGSVTAAPPQSRRPSVALVRGGEHWVVVFGVTGTGARQQIHVRNPTPDRKLLPGAPSPLPLHADGDNCPAGDAHGLASGQIPADEVLSRGEWFATYFIKCTEDQPQWKDKYIVVAPQVVAAKVHRSPEDDDDSVHGAAVDAGTAATAAWRELGLSGLAAEQGWRELSPPATGTHAVRVERLDGTPAFYLTHLPGSHRGALAGVDATTGALRFARLNPPDVMTGRLRAPLKEVVTGAVVARGLPAASFSVRLVWTLCRETFYSPYFPLAEITVPGIPAFYVRLSDLESFTSLS